MSVGEIIRSQDGSVDNRIFQIYSLHQKRCDKPRPGKSIKQCGVGRHADLHVRHVGPKLILVSEINQINRYKINSFYISGNLSQDLLAESTIQVSIECASGSVDLVHHIAIYS